FRSLVFCLFQVARGFFLCQREVALGTVSRAQAFGNLLLTLFQRARDRRPDELHAKENEQYKPDSLADDRHVDVHAITSNRVRWVPEKNAIYYWKISRNAIAIQIIGTASSRPATINMRVCSMLPSSG